MSDWRQSALCGQTDPEEFFPVKGGDVSLACRICQACGVRLECLEFALTHNETTGVWGGLTDRERRKLKRQRRNQRADRVDR